MTRLADIQGHIASMGELQDIVSAMRSLAGMRVQEAQRALPGIRRYAELDGGRPSAPLLCSWRGSAEPQSRARNPSARSYVPRSTALSPASTSGLLKRRKRS